MVESIWLSNYNEVGDEAGRKELKDDPWVSSLKRGCMMIHSK